MDPKGLIVGGFALIYGIAVLRQPAKRRREAEAAGTPPPPAAYRALAIKGAVLVVLALIVLATAILRHHGISP